MLNALGEHVIVSLTPLSSLKDSINPFLTVDTALLCLLAFLTRCTLIEMMRDVLVEARCSTFAFVVREALVIEVIGEREYQNALFNGALGFK